MILVKNLRQKLAELEPSSDRHDLQVADADTGSAVTLALVQRDAMSCLALGDYPAAECTAGPGHASMGRADRRARVTSLLEPLQVLEVDTERSQALLRSQIGTPQQQEPVNYFEVILSGTTSAAVRRFQAAQVDDATAASVRRAQVAFALTHEGLLKLVSDLLGVS